MAVNLAVAGYVFHGVIICAVLFANENVLDEIWADLSRYLRIFKPAHSRLPQPYPGGTSVAVSFICSMLFNSYMFSF